jgi:copper transporter 1
MSFHGGYKETILFDFWETNTVLAFVFSCLGLFVCAALYEGLKLGREKLMMYEVKRREKSGVDSENKPSVR